MNLLKPLLSTPARSRVFTCLSMLFLGVLALRPAVPTRAAGSGTWTLTGSMHVAREGATARSVS